MKNVFIVWTKYQARVENLLVDLKKNLGDFEIIYRNNPPAKPIKKFFFYLRYMIKDYKKIKQELPKIIFVQAPPSYALIVPLLVKKFNKKVKVVCDLHNAMTRNPWLSRLGTQKLLSYCDIIVVHNKVVYDNVINNKLFKKVDHNKIIVLEDKTPYFQKNTTYIDKHGINSKPLIFFPASFNMDEPILDVIKCAKNLPHFQFIMTGNQKKLKRNFNVLPEDLPENVVITGWIENDEYIKLLFECDILLGLTIYNDIQMSVSNEGLGAEKVMVLSDTKALREIYKNGALYTKNDWKSIMKALEYAYNSRLDLKENIKKVKRLKEVRYGEQFSSLVKKLF